MWVICLILLWVIVVLAIIASIFVRANSIQTALVFLVRVTTRNIDLKL